MSRISNMQETDNSKVSQTIFSRNYIETQAGNNHLSTLVTPVVLACNQGAEIDLSVMDGKHNRTGRRQARSLGNSRLIAGSNPAHPIPAIYNHTLLPDTGAGKSLLKHSLTPMSCAHYIHQNIGYGRTINAVSKLPLHQNQQTIVCPSETEGNRYRRLQGVAMRSA